MIFIFFPVGGFGSTIEFCIRNFSKEFESINTEIMADGSMHGYKKECHPCYNTELVDLAESNRIITPVYPNLSFSTVTDTINEFVKVSKNFKVVFITIDTIEMIERNWLFSYYKTGLFLASQPNFENFKKWNNNYKTFSDMQRWEQREYLSFVISDSITEYINAKNLALESWLVINTNDILFNFKESLEQILNYLELTPDIDNLAEFIDLWLTKQQYVLDELILINEILINFQNNKFFEWNAISIIGEAVIQYRLFDRGYKLSCYNLNQFPSNTFDLIKLCQSINSCDIV